VLIAGLRERGVEVVERHRPVWERTRHKAGAFLGPAGMARGAGRFAAAWASLALERPGAGAVDAIVAGYPAQPDAPFAWLAARRRRVPLVVDAMISFWDTLAGDRGRVGAAAGAALASLDRLALAAGDLVLADTQANADFLARRFGVPRSKLAVVPVGAEPHLFPATAQPEGPPHALFVGKLSPLHGLDTLLEAARRPGVPPLRIVGEGQMGAWLAQELRRDRPAGLEHVPWIAYERLGRAHAEAAICLGVFGRSDKAARVVPNKVFQAMAAARPVVTADTPGARELLTDGVDALLVPPGDAGALAAALTRLAADPALRARLGAGARARFEAAGAPSAVAGTFLSALAARSCSRLRD